MTSLRKSLKYPKPVDSSLSTPSPFTHSFVMIKVPGKWSGLSKFVKQLKSFFFFFFFFFGLRAVLHRFNLSILINFSSQ